MELFLKMVAMGEHNFKNANMPKNIVVLVQTSIKRNLANLRKNFDIFFGDALGQALWRGNLPQIGVPGLGGMPT